MPPPSSALIDVIGAAGAEIVDGKFETLILLDARGADSGLGPDRISAELIEAPASSDPPNSVASPVANGVPAWTFGVPMVFCKPKPDSFETATGVRPALGVAACIIFEAPTADSMTPVDSLASLEIAAWALPDAPVPDSGTPVAAGASPEIAVWTTYKAPIADFRIPIASGDSIEVDVGTT